MRVYSKQKTIREAAAVQTVNIDAINKINISAIDLGDTLLRVYWIIATGGVNRDTLNFHFHRHTFYELHFITEGYFLYGFHDRTVRVEKGNFILIPMRIPHRVIEHSADFVKIAVAFEPTEDGGLFSDPLREDRMVFPTTEEMRDSLGFILRQSQHKSKLSGRILKWRLHELIYLVEDSRAPIPVSLTQTVFCDDRLLRAKKYIEDNPGIFFTCTEVAEYCHISVKQLGRLFLRYEKRSLLSFIHQQKAEEAKRRLLTAESTQKTVSGELGFSSVQYFNKFFLRMTGMSPGEFVRQNRME